MHGSNMDVSNIDIDESEVDNSDIEDNTDSDSDQNDIQTDESNHTTLQWLLIIFFRIISQFRLSNNASSAILSFFSFVLGMFIANNFVLIADYYSVY